MTRLHEATHAPFVGFNRAQAAVIEGAVLVEPPATLHGREGRRRDGLPADRHRQDRGRRGARGLELAAAGGGGAPRTRRTALVSRMQSARQRAQRRGGAGGRGLRRRSDRPEGAGATARSAGCPAGASRPSSPRCAYAGCERSISATIGDVPMHDRAALLARVAAVAACGVDLVKVGIEPRHAEAPRVIDALGASGAARRRVPGRPRDRFRARAGRLRARLCGAHARYRRQARGQPVRCRRRGRAAPLHRDGARRAATGGSGRVAADGACRAPAPLRRRRATAPRAAHARRFERAAAVAGADRRAKPA